MTTKGDGNFLRLVHPLAHPEGDRIFRKTFQEGFKLLRPLFLSTYSPTAAPPTALHITPDTRHKGYEQA